MISDIQLELLELLDKNLSFGDENKEYILKALYFVFKENEKLLKSSLDILDQKGFSIMEYCEETVNSRRFWKISGSKNTEYFCMSNFCSCPNFQKLAKSNDIKIFCKHLLAIKIAGMMNLTTINKVSIEKYMEQFNKNYLELENSEFN